LLNTLIQSQQFVQTNPGFVFVRILTKFYYIKRVFFLSIIIKKKQSYIERASERASVTE